MPFLKLTVLLVISLILFYVHQALSIGNSHVMKMLELVFSKDFNPPILGNSVYFSIFSKIFGKVVLKFAILIPHLANTIKVIIIFCVVTL